MRAAAIFTLLVATLVSGCAETESLPGSADGVPVAAGDFVLADIRVGDVFRYGFGFKGPTFSTVGITDVTVLERAPMMDGAGRTRDALHVLQSSPDGGFRETYWVDAETLTQFKRERNINYTEVSRFPVEPLRPIPMRHASYGNGTGTEELYKEDPLFEDYSFFGGFATGRSIPPVGKELGIPGYFWLRDENRVLAVYENLTGKVDKEILDETWGPTRQVTYNLDWREGSNFEQVHYQAAFSPAVPLGVDLLRHIKAKIGTRDIDVAFNATLLAYQPGEGEPVVRTKQQVMPQRRAAEFAAFQRAPADGSGAKLMFPLSEALVTLDKDPTATQFFQAHAGAYLQVAHLSETDTCGFYSQPYPACHWLTWEGRFIAPDDWHLDFRVEKYADGNGAGAAYVPYVSRDYPFEIIFGIGTTPTPPDPPVVAAKGTQDYPARDTLEQDALTVAGAIALFKGSAWLNLSALDPNFVVVFLDDGGYGYHLSRDDWVFPSQNPELVFFYDEGPLVLERHTAVIGPDANVLESRNFFTHVTQR